MSIKSYKDVFQRSEDFVVNYRFYTPEENGRQTLPSQHIRCDFGYEHEDHQSNQVFMIHPEFVDSNGTMLVEGQMPREGIAKMWILSTEMFDYHKCRLKVGQEGHFYEGPRKTALCQITHITGLNKL